VKSTKVFSGMGQELTLGHKGGGNSTMAEKGSKLKERKRRRKSYEGKVKGLRLKSLVKGVGRKDKETTSKSTGKTGKALGRRGGVLSHPWK